MRIRPRLAREAGTVCRRPMVGATEKQTLVRSRPGDPFRQPPRGRSAAVTSPQGGGKSVAGDDRSGGVRPGFSLISRFATASPAGGSTGRRRTRCGFARGWRVRQERCAADQWSALRRNRRWYRFAGAAPSVSRLAGDRRLPPPPRGEARAWRAAEGVRPYDGDRRKREEEDLVREGRERSFDFAALREAMTERARSRPGDPFRQPPRGRSAAATSPQGGGKSGGSLCCGACGKQKNLLCRFCRICTAGLICIGRSDRIRRYPPQPW